jgi:hypothetical protein
MSENEYPASLKIDYPEKLSRLTTFFRGITVIPILVILSLVNSSNASWNATDSTSFEYTGIGILFIPLVLMLLFRQKYPRWWFDWNLALYRFSTRVCAYFALLRDEYPSTDEEQAVHLDIAYPDAAKDLNQWLPLVKWLLAIPHYIVLAFLFIAVVVCVVIAWFAILFTGTYPRGLFDFVVGVLRWELRVISYSILLTTDDYPPFSLD